MERTNTVIDVEAIIAENNAELARAEETETCEAYLKWLRKHTTEYNKVLHDLAYVRDSYKRMSEEMTPILDNVPKACELAQEVEDYMTDMLARIA